MKLITLTQGLAATVDDDDFEALSAHKWYATQARLLYYAARAIPISEGGGKILMHRLLFDFPKGMSIDHIDGDGLNNCRANLRLATHAENMRNRGRQKNNSSGFKGVFWDDSSKQWMSRIKVEGRPIYLGLFSTPAEAYVAYCAAAVELHGEFARIV